MHLLYSAALAATLVVSSPWWLLQMLRHGKYRAGLAERFGRVPARVVEQSRHVAQPPSAVRPSGPSPIIWVHAVSVGEVLAVSGLIAELRRRFPEHRVVISTTTATGQKLARDKFGAQNVFYFPLDFAFAIRRYLRTLRPELIVVAETEFWPNFLRLAHEAGAKIAIVNARISNRSFPRYRRLRKLVTPVLRPVDLFLAQSLEDARRLHDIGAPADRIQVSGNLKFDIAPPTQAPFATELKRRLDDSAAFPVLVCGSTVEGEEFALFGLFQTVLRKYPNALMVMAPRHPERFEQVAQLAASFNGLRLWRRSQLPLDTVLRGGVLLLDTIGELASVYAVATVALVGGSFAPRGGHNILEPAFFGVPIIVGPHTENFRDIISAFRQDDAVCVATAFREGDDKGNLSRTVLDLLDRSDERQALGRRAAEVVRTHAGGTARTLEALTSLLAVEEPARR